jgi:hypothetical protein
MSVRQNPLFHMIAGIARRPIIWIAVPIARVAVSIIGSPIGIRISGVVIIAITIIAITIIAIADDRAEDASGQGACRKSGTKKTAIAKASAASESRASIRSPNERCAAIGASNGRSSETRTMEGRATETPAANSSAAPEPTAASTTAAEPTAAAKSTASPRPCRGEVPADARDERHRRQSDSQMLPHIFKRAHGTQPWTESPQQRNAIPGMQFLPHGLDARRGACVTKAVSWRANGKTPHEGAAQ